MTLLKLGWFSTGNGEGSLGLLQKVQGAIESGELSAQIQFVFSNREVGEADGSDKFLHYVRDCGIPTVTLSSKRFRKQHGGGQFSIHRSSFDEAVMDKLKSYTPDICVLAGYMLITGASLCNRYPMLNLHPALPGGPVGTWKDVIWKIIEEKNSESGAYIHLATEDLDQGPLLTYYSFPLLGNKFDNLWNQVQGRSIEDIKSQEGEDLPLFQHIRQEGIKRERPLLLETLKTFAQGNLQLKERQPINSSGSPISGLCLNETINKIYKLA